MRTRASLVLSVLLSIFVPVLASLSVLAQQAPQPLHNHVRSAVSSGRAALAGPMPAHREMRLSIVLEPRNQAALSALLQRITDPTSPDYRHYLSVQQFTEQFAPTAAEYQSVVDFATAHGLTVTGAPANRLVVPIRGSVEQVEKAFHVSMNLYKHPTEARNFYSPDREPTLDLGVPVRHISGLNDYSRPRPALSKRAQGQAKPDSAGSGPSSSYLPSDLRAAYYGDGPLTGSGQSVGILEFDGYYVSDVVDNFNGTASSTNNGSNYVLTYTPLADGTTYTLPVNNVLLDGATGAPTGGDDAEEALDIAQVVGMAPGLSQVLVYIGASDADILNQMAADDLAKSLSVSWAWQPDDPGTDDIFFQEFAAQGQSVFVASGDYGAYSLESDFYYPAEDTWITAVGATHLDTNGTGGPWLDEQGWIDSGGGPSPDGIKIPSWQTTAINAANGGSTTLRNVPDVAAEGDYDNFACDIGYCDIGYGGTSFAAPRWAGFAALIDQQAAAEGNPYMGFAAPLIYKLGASTNYDSDLHDITVGNNSAFTQGFNAVPGYDLVTGWGSPTGQPLIDALSAGTPGFNLSAASTAVSVNQGLSVSDTIAIARQTGFTGTVHLAVASALPSGVTATWYPGPTSATQTLTLTASGKATVGSLPVIVTGASGTITSSTVLTLAVGAPSFTLNAMPVPQTLAQGGTLQSTVFVVPQGHFTGAVTLSTTGLPAGVTASFATNPVTRSSLLTLSAAGTAAAGSYTFHLLGNSASAPAVDQALPLTITARPAAGYALTASPAFLSLGQGATATATVAVAAMNGAKGTPQLVVRGLPPGVSGALSAIPNSTNRLLTLTARSSAVPGAYSALICNAAFGCKSQYAQINVTVVPAPSFSLAVSGGALVVSTGSPATATVTVTPQPGFNGSVKLGAFGLPRYLSATFSANPASGKSVLTVSATPSAVAGTYSLVVGGTAGAQTVNAALSLQVLSGTRTTLSVTPRQTVVAGERLTLTATVTPDTGFPVPTGLVVFTVGQASYPARLNASGVATYTGPAPSGVSSLSLSAAYRGSSTFAASSSTAVTETVIPPTESFLVIEPDSATLTAGEAYTLTATVVPKGGSGTPTGKVVFAIGSVQHAVTLSSAGTATFAGKAPSSAGSVSISAAYGGSASFAASTSNTLVETVNP